MKNKWEYDTKGMKTKWMGKQRERKATVWGIKWNENQREGKAQ